MAAIPSLSLVLCPLLGLAALLDDTAVLLQTSKVNFDAPYAFEKYGFGEVLEAKTKDGWASVTVLGMKPDSGSYTVHVSEDYPGYDIPEVPAKFLRRFLGTGQADYLVDNSKLQHGGRGLKYRHSKDTNDKSDEYAPWGSIVVGADEHDGWIRTSSGLLPFFVRGTEVLKRVDRRDTLVLVSESPPQRGMVTFSPGDQSEFRTKAGDWLSSVVTGPGRAPNTYNILVKPNDSQLVPVTSVSVLSLRKPSRELQSGSLQQVPVQPPSCARNACLMLRVRTQDDREFMLQVSKSSKLEMMMKMVCSKLKRDWDTCQTQSRFTHDGTEITPWTHLSLSGLKNDDLIVLEDAPAPSPGL